MERPFIRLFIRTHLRWRSTPKLIVNSRTSTSYRGSNVVLAHTTCIHGQSVAFHGRFIALMFLYKRREKSLTYTVTNISRSNTHLNMDPFVQV